MSRRLPVLLTAVPLALLAVAASGCGRDAPRGDPLTGGDATGPAARPMQGLPEGHPPIPEGHPPMPAARPPVPEGHPPMDGAAKPPVPAPGASAFEWTAPEGWKATTPASTMRIAQFDVPGAWPDGVPVVCALFGQIGGGKQANIDRWIGQFRQADGTPSKDRTKVADSKAGELAVTRIELTGAFSDGMQKPPRQTDDGMLLGGIVEAPDGASIYVKLTGPRKVVADQAAAFDAFLASFRPAKR